MSAVSKVSKPRNILDILDIHTNIPSSNIHEHENKDKREWFFWFFIYWTVECFTTTPPHECHKCKETNLRPSVCPDNELPHYYSPIIVCGECNTTVAVLLNIHRAPNESGFRIEFLDTNFGKEIMVPVVIWGSEVMELIKKAVNYFS